MLQANRKSRTLARLLMGVYVYRPQTKLGQGNVFTPVCHSVHRGVYNRGVCIRGVSTSGGVCIGDVCMGGGMDLHPGRVCIQEGSAPRGWADPPIGYYGIQSTNGRYASYWNAFLFQEGNRVGYSWYQVPRFSRENLL